MGNASKDYQKDLQAYIPRITHFSGFGMAVPTVF